VPHSLHHKRGSATQHQRHGQWASPLSVEGSVMQLGRSR
jgi:hypothetical protein